MIDQLLIILLASAHRLPAVPLDVCAKSFSIDKSKVFHLRCRSILPASTCPTALFPFFRPPQSPSNPNSKRSSIADTASFK
jgi:hypothetical protein